MGDVVHFVVESVEGEVWGLEDEGLKFHVYKMKRAYITSKVTFWLQNAMETVSGNYAQNSGPNRK